MSTKAHRGRLRAAVEQPLSNPAEGAGTAAALPPARVALLRALRGSRHLIDALTTAGHVCAAACDTAPQRFDIAPRDVLWLTLTDLIITSTGAEAQCTR